MPDSMLLPIALAGGAAYYLTQDGERTQLGPLPGEVISPGKFPNATIGAKLAGIKASAIAPRPNGSSSSYGINPYVSGGGGNQPGMQGADTAMEQKLREAEAFIKTQIDGASAETKKQGAKILNEELKLDPPLKGDESYEDIARIAGAAAGAAAGGAVCGPVCAKLGAIAGAYLGVKLEEWLSGKWDDIKDWADDQWDSVKDLANDAYDAIADLF